MSQIIERIPHKLGEVILRRYEERDLQAQADYLFTSPPEFLESIGFDSSKLQNRAEWESALKKRRAEALAKGLPPNAAVAELGGRAVSMVFHDPFSDDGISRLHFHIFDPALRGKGLGAPIFLAGTRDFARIHCKNRFLIEPKASNGPMNALMRKLGFKHLGEFTIPAGPQTRGFLANRYEILVP